MFNNLYNYGKTNKGRTTTKILAILLVFALTFSNFALLGKYLGNAFISYALNENDTNTNVDNVKFDVYVNQIGQRETSADINNDEIKVGLCIKVQNGGVLNSGTVTLENTNFKIKGNENLSSINFDLVQSGQEKEKYFNIVADKSEDFNLDLLNKISQIKLTGTYKNNNGEEVPVEATKEIKINWDCSNITDENNPIKLKQEFITNKIYSINEVEKRVVQVKVVSGIENNVYPIKDTKIKLNVPTIPNNVEPEEIKVASYGTYATNGKDGFESWAYDENEKTITINNAANENNTVKWLKDGEDIFIVTYIYDKDVDISAIESQISSEVNLYSSNNVKLTKSSRISATNMAEKGSTITHEVDASNLIYKGKMKAGEETGINVKNTIQVGYAQIGNEIVLTNVSDIFEGDEISNINADTYFKQTTINKNELLRILGEDGSLEISYIDNENQEHSIATINNASESDANGNVSIAYDEQYNNLVFTTTAPATEGQINILNTKMIKPGNLNESDLAKINKLKSNYNIKVDDIIDLNGQDETTVKNSTTIISLGLENNRLSTTQENNVNITATLKTNGAKYDLYKNPSITIKMPEEVKSIELTGEPTILNPNGLTLGNHEIVGDEIRIQLNGEQSSYTNTDTQVLVSAKVVSNNMLPSLDRDIIMTSTNEKATEFENNELNYAESKAGVKFVSERGVLLANGISGYNGEEPEVVAFKTEEKQVTIGEQDSQAALIKGTIINNEGKDLSNVTVIGKINGKINATVNCLGATVYYTHDAEVNENSNWDQNVTGANFTGYKIVINELADKQVVEFTYSVDTSTIISGDLIYTVFEDGKSVTSPKLVLKAKPAPIVENSDMLSLTINADPETTQVLRKGQEVVLNIAVKNIKESSKIVINEQDHLTRGGLPVLVDLTLSDGIQIKKAEITANGETTVSEDTLQKYFSTERIIDYNKNLIIKLTLRVEEETDVSYVTGTISAKARVIDETGLADEAFEGEATKGISYNIERDNKITNIVAPQEISLKIGETKPIEYSIEPADIDASGITIVSADEDIAKIVNGNQVQGVSDGSTIVTIEDANGGAKKEITINVTKVETQNHDGEALPDDDIDAESTPKIDDLDEGNGTNNNNPGENQNENQTYTISGLAWLDENKNGEKDESEKALPGITVKIWDNDQEKYLTNAEGKEITAITALNGKYEFTELKPGKYTLIFDYNQTKYRLTPKTGEDSKVFAVTTDNETVIKTNTIEIKNSNIEDINIGLVLNNESDLELTKYITNIVVQNADGTKSTTYDASQLAKVEIDAKKLSGSTVIVEYVMEVKNNGKIPAYAKKIVDYMPQDFKFSSEMNTNWYQDTDGNLYTEQLAKTEIKPGESAKVKLILIKNMTNSNTGLVNNSAEIYEDYNEYAANDKNSTPGNKEEKENDYSSADMIVGVKTGGSSLYIGIIIISMIVLGGGIYLINKKIIKGNNI